MDLTTTVLSGSARPLTEGQEDNLSDKLHQRMKRSWVWNQFFVLEEYTGTDPLYVGKLHSDMDRGDGSIKYILSGEGAGIVFTIDDTTGDIHAIQRLDREERSQYTLRAQALDRRTGRPMEPESEFIIKIQDINDNEPKFLDGPYVASVPEMSPVGTSVIQVTATDADDPTYGNSARVVYSILQGQPYFSVDSRTGLIRTALMNMDREAKEYYEVIIQAKDMGGQLGGLAGTTTVNITLSDVNDNPPRFPQKHYQMSVLESAPVSSTVGRVVAKDLDEGINAEMKYSLVDGDGLDVFDINTDPNYQVGIITVRKPLSFESKKSYTLKVEGSNPHLEMRFLNLGPFRDTTTVHISVEDVDEPPVFEPSFYFVEVPEDVEIGTTIQIISAKDPDVTNNSVRLANVTPIHKKGEREAPGSYRPVSLISVPGKVVEQIIFSHITRHVQDNQVIRPSQHGFMKGRSCLTNLISFCDKVTHLVDEGKAVDVVYLDFSKAFDTISHSILLEKLAAHGLDRHTLHWVKKLAGWLGPKSCGEWS
ncbi:cadherin-20 [Grus japonensis]|uniref:Cadherin-20 n=1 Tax=Grus japonensis TaxID=30415 RepID=A0ABC9WDU7_GRUJA